MTQKEFDHTEFKAGMFLVHPAFGRGRIVGVNLQERLIEVSFDDGLGYDWVRCENVELIKE